MRIKQPRVNTEIRPMGASLRAFISQKLKDHLPFLLLILFSVSFLMYFYGKILFHPNDYMFCDVGDGIKNYFTFSFHVKPGNSLVNFQGMNYPFGENFLYTDCHPAFVMLLKAIGPLGYFITSHPVGFINFMVIVSIFLSFYACYFLLKELGINPWIRLLFAIFMTLLAPQLFRVPVHFALSYSLAIPLSWFLFIKIQGITKGWKYPMLLFFNLVFWLFIHAYLGVMIVFFLTSLSIIQWVFSPSIPKSGGRHFLNLVYLLLPLLIFYSTVKVTDTHINRTNNPSGFYTFNCEPDDIFIPHYPTLSHNLNEYLEFHVKHTWEGWAYVGLATDILLLYILIICLLYWFGGRRNKIYPLLFNHPPIQFGFIAGFMVLLFAMAFPFKSIHWIAETFPFFKQFRGSGRFAWVFYFTSLVLAAKFIQAFSEYFLSKQKKIRVILASIALTLTYLIEGIPYHTTMAWQITQSRNLFDSQWLPDTYKQALKSIQPEDYQAIIPLPFYYQGSENLSRPKKKLTEQISIVFSYHSGIPLVSADLTRTSIHESRDVIQLLSPPFYPKALESKISSQKDFLLLRTLEPLSPAEENLLNRSQPIFQNEAISLYRISKAALFAQYQGRIIEEFEKKIPKLIPRKGFLASDDTSFFFYQGFNLGDSSHAFRGAASFSAPKEGKHYILTFPPYCFSAHKTYHFSCWMFNGQQDALNDWLRVSLETCDSNLHSTEILFLLPEFSEVIVGNWSYIEGEFNMPHPEHFFSVTTTGGNYAHPMLYLDEVMIRESGLEVYQEINKGQEILYNNHSIKK